MTGKSGAKKEEELSDVKLDSPYGYGYSESFKPKKAGFQWRSLSIKRLLGLLTVIILISILSVIPNLLKLKKSKVVIILAANEGGGVQRWKTPQEWSVERSSIANKKEYAEKHGYILTIKDVSLKRRYSHEWREGWEKVDILKQTMRQFPDAEWFWWLDLYTFIMEPEVDLEQYLLDHVEDKTYRTLDHFNPLNIEKDLPYVDTRKEPVDLVLAQDCGGFNLGSFFVRRSPWSELLLDLWWDPAMYDQMHMKWEHKEQDCLEVLYSKMAWVRNRIGFVPLRAINSFPPGACSDQKDDPRYFYNDKERDFVVNMAGCNYGDRSCWDEYEYYRKLQKKFRETPWYRLW
ncbi:alpha-1,6-mannosyltransferase [Brettanomyces nanus]|uniref:Alpha-1,6-mannosyltransferase n=1 Tax=Eeniella nana TaxID=13502 RepID=A0A875RQI9_EENNA|nr:alpha-1,6-mannosyltransferase [Brettanomyces nanus]QPG77120.1 alpha-1,6-mannosyltransferase [Brettanomyces nanus]